MSQSPSSSQNMMEVLSEIDSVAFYSSSNLNVTLSSSQPGPLPSVLSDLLFEGDLSKERKSEPNILAASEELVVESLTKMREGIRTPFSEEGERTHEDSLETPEPLFNRTP
ncbi:hypothetical protein R3W88_022550 [Solanum pinnatisectum]|uniref:Uncharacterized protein n=1 Tax=Solanum pinnatisectum TaxID=50273 RepID=A0AAV9LUZ8_9SOLN|nr:hypothetical protein R3W88_022550 [Solanum pinnatisectum]